MKLLLSAFVCVLIASAPTVRAMPQPSDSIGADNADACGTKFSATQLIVPSALIATGILGICNGAIHEIDGAMRDGIANSGTCLIKADNYVQYLPVASYLGLGAMGVRCTHSFRDRFMAGATAYLSMGVMVNALKFSISERRPDSSARNSFPSGHTATVFMGAELMRLEYGAGWGLGGYAVASSVAFLRIYNRRHWLNDVLAGAGIGILSARIGYWMLPLYQKWFHWSGTRAIAVVPGYNPWCGGISIGVAAVF